MNELSPTLRPVTITPKPRQGRFQRLSPVQFIELTGLVAFAQACLAFAQAVRGRRFLPAPGRGRPKVYSDLCIFLTSIIQRVWQKSNEGIIQYLYDQPLVAVALLYPVDLPTGQVSIIHPAHYGRRKRQLGLFVYFVAFVALARRLIQMGIIIGRELVLDCSGLQAWYHNDSDARWNDFLKIFGYKIHLIMDSASLLPIMLCITPANVHESVPGVILLLAVWLFYNLGVRIVRADAAYIVGDAPVFERFYGGGFGSIRGFDFRGVSPRAGVFNNRVGGDFILLTGAEYSFPLYAKTVRGVTFLDMGTVEEDFGITSWRASVGFGFRVTINFFGPVPFVFDFGWPIAKDDDDDTRVFNFSMGASF